MERDPHTYSIIGAAMAVHSFLGPGFMEVAYQRALSARFQKDCIPFEREHRIPMFYEGVSLGTFRADFLCFDQILVEIKAEPFTSPRPVRQLSHYLRATGLPVGLLLNFGLDRLRYERVVAPVRSASGSLPA